MELYDVMRTPFAAREFADEPIPDTVLHKILDNFEAECARCDQTLGRPRCPLRRRGAAAAHAG